MNMRVVLAGTAVAVAGLVSGCVTAVAGSPAPSATQPTTTSETSGSASPSERLSPPVENPKDLTGIDPCDFLPPDQKTELGLTKPGTRDTSPWGEETCGLAGSIVAIGFSPDTTVGEGLDQAYRSKNNFYNFEPSEIDGYPAVRVNFVTQSCDLIVGVSDEQTLSMGITRVSPDAPGKGDPCGFAESVMSDVLKNVPDA
jgi:hypothetical protein